MDPRGKRENRKALNAGSRRRSSGIADRRLRIDTCREGNSLVHAGEKSEPNGRHHQERDAAQRSPSMRCPFGRGVGGHVGHVADQNNVADLSRAAIFERQTTSASNRLRWSGCDRARRGVHMNLLKRSTIRRSTAHAAKPMRNDDGSETS